MTNKYIVFMKNFTGKNISYIAGIKYRISSQDEDNFYLGSTKVPKRGNVQYRVGMIVDRG